ncbi:hydroxyacid dehydrogenase [Polymorphospora rubra]|uniref:Hydroxyacid dehydrogenase n=1 Tax=Polymorphospora rubra TaxID=338584 RepID=A0A810MSA4_9ACTN|nr:hydroxyacid dehydrogenase [Polymorphospora rubra]BCJ64087.1 hydroxyacid dehydrogenase [Polymorphospora rubra]
MTGHPQTLLVMADDTYRALFDADALARIRRTARLAEPAHVTRLDTGAARTRLAEVEVLVTGWGCPPLDDAVLSAAPRLRAVLHAAGTVKEHVTDACWARGLLVTSAAEANAVPVAEYTVAAVLFAGKRVPQAAALSRLHRTAVHASGERSNRDRVVGVVGFSRIGRRVVDLLRPYDLRVLVADPYADPATVGAAGATLVELDELLRASDVVSLHAPSLPATRHLLDRRRLALMPDGATLINTARGALVDTAALTDECAAGRLSALLDVTDPEPLPTDSPLWLMPNVFITPHVAGSLDGEVRRLADAAIEELERYARGAPPLHPVHSEHLLHMA